MAPAAGRRPTSHSNDRHSHVARTVGKLYAIRNTEDNACRCSESLSSASLWS